MRSVVHTTYKSVSVVRGTCVSTPSRHDEAAEKIGTNHRVHQIVGAGAANRTIEIRPNAKTYKNHGSNRPRGQ